MWICISRPNSSRPAASGARQKVLVSGDLQAGQHMQLLATVIEWRVFTDQCLHAAHAGREASIDDVQNLVGGKLSSVTMRAQVVRHRNFDRADGGKNLLGT